MLNDKVLIKLIRYIELDMKDIDMNIAYSVITKIQIYGFELFENKKLLTKKERKIFNKANKEISTKK